MNRKSNYQNRIVKVLEKKEFKSLDSLYKVFNTYKRIFLLGSGGLGKSTELEHLESILLAEGKTVYKKNLKDFLDDNKIKKFVFGEKTIINDQILLLDGLDEMRSVNLFLSKLNSFLEKNKNIQCIISCRSNVYNEFSLETEHLRAVYLEPLTVEQVDILIESKIGKKLSSTMLDKYYSFLDTPFNINLFCDYYNNKQAFPDSQNEIWSLLVDTELDKLNKKHFKNAKNLDKSHIHKCLQKVAIFNETMHIRSIEDSDLYELLEEVDKGKISMISFIELLPNDKYSFRHKIYQEYFAACYLKKLSLDDLLKYISNNNRINSSMQNVMFFLLNILEINELESLIEWLLENDSKWLFLCESHRLSKELKEKIFRNYFESQIIIKRLNLPFNDQYFFSQLVDFIDVKYIFNILDNSNDNKAISIAIYLLGLSKTNSNQIEIYNRIQAGVLSDKHNEFYLKAYIEKQYQLRDIEKFTIILNHYKANESDDIHHNLIVAISYLEVIDKTIFEHFLNSVKKLYQESSDDNKVLTIRYTEYYIGNIMLEKLNVKQIKEILKLIGDSDFSLKLTSFFSDKFEEDLSKKLTSFIKADSLFINDIIDFSLEAHNNFYSYLGYFYLKPLLDLQKHDLVIDYIISQKTINHDSILVLKNFITKNNINQVAERFSSVNPEIRYFELIINMCFETDNDLGYTLEDIFVKQYNITLSSHLLETKVKTKDDIEFENKNILFDLDLFKIKLNDFFKELAKEEIDFNDLREYKRTIIRNNSSFIILSTVFIDTIGGIILRKKETVNKESILLFLKDDFFVLELINDKILSNAKTKLTSQQEEFIKQKALKCCLNVDFEEIFTLNSENYITHSKQEILKIKLLLSLDEKIEINYASDFYINVLQYANSILMNYDLKYLSQKIDKELFNKQIEVNILSKKLNNHSLKAHINYALDFILRPNQKVIKEFILNNVYIQQDKEILKKYCQVFLKEDPFWFLAECSSSDNLTLRWNAIDLMLEYKIEEDYIIRISKDHLNNIFEQKSNSDFIYNAIDVLFYFNDSSALENYSKALEHIDSCNKGKFNLIYLDKLSSLNPISDLNSIESIFDYLYLNTKEEYIGMLEYTPLYRIICNLSKNELNYSHLNRHFNEMKEKVKYNESHYTYIYTFLEAIESIYNTTIVKKKSSKEIKKSINADEIKNNMKQPNFNIDNCNHVQIQVGDNPTINNSYNSSSNLEPIIAILKEFEQLKEDNEEWKAIFMNGMKDLIELNDSIEHVTNEAVIKRSSIKKLGDWLSSLADKTEKWAKVIELPLTLQDKVGKLEELFKLVNTLFNR